MPRSHAPLRTNRQEQDGTQSEPRHVPPDPHREPGDDPIDSPQRPRHREGDENRERRYPDEISAIDSYGAVLECAE